jgi:hypothetical protein
MAKARKSSTPKAKSANADTYPRFENAKRELLERVAKREIAEALAKLQSRLQREGGGTWNVKTLAKLRKGIPPWDPEKAQKQAEEARKFGERIDRAIAIRDNLIPPPWMNKPKEKDGPAIARARAALLAVYPNGRVPPDHLTKMIRGKINDELERRGKKNVGYDTVRRLRLLIDRRR